VLVDFKGESGDVSEGYVGGYGHRLLPTGWVVETTRPDSVTVTFRNGNRVAERRIL